MLHKEQRLAPGRFSGPGTMFCPYYSQGILRVDHAPFLYHHTVLFD